MIDNPAVGANLPPMRISLAWITRLLGVADLGVTVEQLQELLTLRVAEIENDIERVGPDLTGVVVGRVLTCSQHPNADRLRCTTVDIGGASPVPIVCGAPNVAVGQLVAVATVGTTLTMPGPDGKPKSLTIKAAKLRGEPSEGMICAEDELGLGAGHDGILVLSGDHRPGTPLAGVLGVGDTVLVIDNHGISHRPDLWGHWGWAREIAAVLRLPPPADPDIAWRAVGEGWSATLDDAGCTTYLGAVVEGVANRESPEWMRRLLEAVGIRPLGLLIDVTNYVMLELGEPLHAFDRRQIGGTAIGVRAATAGESFTTLDGKQHALGAGDLLINDPARGGAALALAGVMGGENSAVRDDTSTIVIEAAVFRPERIRRARVKLGAATDSSARFEKGLQPESAVAGLNRAIQLITELCPGARCTHRFAAGATAGEQRTVEYAAKDADRIAGLALAGDDQLALLSRLGFHAHGLRIAVPWWRRKDIHVTADLVEEVLRLHGFHHIKPEVPRLPAAAPAVNQLRAAEHRARAALSAQGWDEVVTYGFTSDAWATLLGWGDDRVIRVRNPLSADWTMLRPALAPNLAEAIARNRKHLDEVALYEVGKRYGAGMGRGDTPDEELVVVGAYAKAGDDAPFYAARDAGLSALRGLGYDPTFAPAKTVPPYLDASRTVDLHVDGKPFGVAGELTAAVRDAAGCPERVGLFGISLERLMDALGPAKPVRYAPPSRFQMVDRDFTFDAPEDLAYADLVAPLRQAAGALCARVDLVTIYRGDPLPAGRKAVSLRVHLIAGDRTLDEKELAKVSGAIQKRVESTTPATLRAG